MSFRSSRPHRHAAAISISLFLACALGAVLATASAHAAAPGQFKMLLCANNVTAGNYGTYTNTASPQNPWGIFDFQNNCGWSSDPAGDSAFLRISENQAAGSAGNGAVGYFYWDAPPFVHFKTAGGWTRQPNAFNDGWRSRFWGVDVYGNGFQIMTQGAGLGSTGTFAPHLWPGGNADFTRFAFELSCVRPVGCDRANFNATDANTFVFTLADDQSAQISLGGGPPLLAGIWSRGTQTVPWTAADNGSGLRYERVRVDGVERFAVDHWAECNMDTDQATGAYARSFQPCPLGPFAHSYALDTASLADGAHGIQVCDQDYGQAVGLNGTGSESCDQRTVYTDNTAPGAPLGLHVVSPNPARYLSQLGAIFSLPPNQGSPITKVHYDVVDGAGHVVVPEKVATGINLTELAKVEGPAAPGAYQLRVWLEDAVGFTGPAASVPIPRDTTPPAAPQDLSVAAPTAPRSAQGFDVRWRNIVDAGSPITALHYEIVNGAGAVVVPAKTITGDNPQAIGDLDAPRERGTYTLRLWLQDAEGNVGAPAKVPLAYDCVRSEVSGGLTLSAGLGKREVGSMLVDRGIGATLRGKLLGFGGQIAEAPLCVFSTVASERDPHFLGVAVTAADGSYEFAVGAGPTRELEVHYRPDQRELTASATLRTTGRPTFRLKGKFVHNGGYAVFEGNIPGPGNENVIVALQVKSGEGWRVFRIYRTRRGGRFVMRYRLTQTRTATTYIVRVAVKRQSGYDFEPGYSREIPLRVIP